MNVSRPFTCRRTRLRWIRPVAIVLTIVMALMTNGGSHWLMPTVEAQQQVAPVSQGFNINAEDLRFIFQQILVAQEHASGGTPVGWVTTRDTAWCDTPACRATGSITTRRRMADEPADGCSRRGRLSAVTSHVS